MTFDKKALDELRERWPDGPLPDELLDAVSGGTGGDNDNSIRVGTLVYFRHDQGGCGFNCGEVYFILTIDGSTGYHVAKSSRSVEPFGMFPCNVPESDIILYTNNW